jgi:hypothetical protein
MATTKERSHKEFTKGKRWEFYRMFLQDVQDVFTGWIGCFLQDG